MQQNMNIGKAQLTNLTRKNDLSPEVKNMMSIVLARAM